ncbi:retrovirus-related pol polyprotein from transposon TNT 1-94 [Tanacetum coccineum]
MLKTSLICLLSKASKSKSWLWHHRLSHLNFGTLNKLAKDGLARGSPRLKFQKDHLCSACALGKRKKSSHQPKSEDTNQEKLYLLHMDLFLKTKDEAPEAIIKCIKNIQVRLNATIRNVRTDNGTEFVNQTLREFYENLTTMASEQFSSGPGLHLMTPATSCSGLVPNTVSQQPCIPPNRDNWDHLFQPMFDEYFTPPSIVVSPVKTDKFGRVLKNKARLVAQGFRQEEGINFEESFAPTTRFGVGTLDVSLHLVHRESAVLKVNIIVAGCQRSKSAMSYRVQRLNILPYRGCPVVFDALALTPCYSAFLITVDVLEVYTHQLWDSVYKHDTFYRLKMDKRKRFKLNLEVFRYIFKIFPRVHGQDFDALPIDDEIMSFLRDLGHTGEIHSLNDVVVAQMHQPWRTFAALINKSLSGKTTSLDKLRLSRA